MNVLIFFEGPCDTEGWSNDAENVAFYHRNNYTLKYITIEMLLYLLLHLHLDVYI